ncbi:MAG: DUF3368 domain-containing protein [Acidobacteriota bacterium]
MTRAVVADAGPLIALSKLNLLPVLRLLYERVHFTGGVYDEAVTAGRRLGHEDAQELASFLKRAGWEAVHSVGIRHELDGMPLDRGEKESISLALDMSALLLMDEGRGREMARRLHLPLKGTLGVLIQAYRRGFLAADELRHYFEQIETRKDIWISPGLCRRLLQEEFGQSSG